MASVSFPQHPHSQLCKQRELQYVCLSTSALQKEKMMLLPIQLNAWQREIGLFGYHFLVFSLPPGMIQCMSTRGALLKWLSVVQVKVADENMHCDLLGKDHSMSHVRMKKKEKKENILLSLKAIIFWWSCCSKNNSIHIFHSKLWNFQIKIHLRLAQHLI